MKIDFDSAKDRTNRSKHGVSFAFAAGLDWDAMWVRMDDADDYGEERWIGVAPRGIRLYTVVFTVRGDETMRIISLRRATNQEIKHYESQNAKK